MSSSKTPEEIAESHRWHAIESNNRAWELTELTARTPDQDAEMLDAAHAASFHWRLVGMPLHAARAQMLLAHVHALLGQGELSLRNAERSHSFFLENQPADWELAFSHAILAHAAWAAGDVEMHREQYARAESLGSGIVNAEERDIFLQTFRTIPQP